MKKSAPKELADWLTEIQKLEEALFTDLLIGYWLYEFIKWLLYQHWFYTTIQQLPPGLYLT